MQIFMRVLYQVEKSFRNVKSIYVTHMKSDDSLGSSNSKGASI